MNGDRAVVESPVRGSDQPSRLPESRLPDKDSRVPGQGSRVADQEDPGSRLPEQVSRIPDSAAAKAAEKQASAVPTSDHKPVGKKNRQKEVRKAADQQQRPVAAVKSIDSPPPSTTTIGQSKRGGVAKASAVPASLQGGVGDTTSPSDGCDKKLVCGAPRSASSRTQPDPLTSQHNNNNNNNVSETQKAEFSQVKRSKKKKKKRDHNPSDASRAAAAGVIAAAAAAAAATKLSSDSSPAAGGGGGETAKSHSAKQPTSVKNASSRFSGVVGPRIPKR